MLLLPSNRKQINVMFFFCLTVLTFISPAAHGIVHRVFKNDLCKNMIEWQNGKV